MLVVIQFLPVMGKLHFVLQHCYRLDLSSYFRTPDKVYYSKLRAAFATPGTTAYPTHVGSYSRTNDNDLPFVLMMQQQQQQNPMDHDQQQEHNVKSNFYASGDSENETAPDDFILVEVVRPLRLF